MTAHSKRKAPTMLTQQIPVIKGENIGTPQGMYVGPNGSLGGAAGGMVAVLGCAVSGTAEQFLFGNTDLATGGWQIQAGGGGNTITASVVDSVGLKNATYAAGSLLPSNWLYVGLIVTPPAPNSTLVLVVNSKIIAVTPLVGAVVPFGGTPFISHVGNPGDGGGVFAAGYAGSFPVSSESPLDQFSDVVRSNGTLAPDALAGFFDNYWTTRFYNDGAHPPVAAPQPAANIWLPQKGAISLTKQNSPTVATFTLPWFA